MEHKTAKEFFALNLPKWPQLIIVGDPVTEEQARDIIFRTDRFLSSAGGYLGGNNKQWNDRYMRESGLDKIKDASAKLPNPAYSWRFELDVEAIIQNQIGYVKDREYIHNSWASCAYVFGPYGFCSPDGRIFYGDNIGKWPDVESVYQEFTLIAQAFPYLNFEACLYGGERGDTPAAPPIVSFIVKYGEVSMTLNHNAKLREVDAEFALKHRTDARMIARITRGTEQGLPLNFVEFYKRELRGIIPDAIAEVLTYPQYQKGFEIGLDGKVDGA